MTPTFADLCAKIEFQAELSSASSEERDTYAITLLYRDRTMTGEIQVMSGWKPTCDYVLSSWLEKAEQVNPEKGWTFSWWIRHHHPPLKSGAEAARLYAETCARREELQGFLGDYEGFVEALSPTYEGPEFRELCQEVHLWIREVVFPGDRHPGPNERITYRALLLYQERQAHQEFLWPRGMWKPTIVQVLSHWLQETNEVYGGAFSTEEMQTGARSLERDFENWRSWLMAQESAKTRFEGFEASDFQRMYDEKVASLKSLYAFLGSEGYFRFRKALKVITFAQE